VSMDVSIGHLARLTGLPVKTIRYYSDIGLLPSTRTASRYRRYSETALARLELIRALRDLGFDLATTRRIAERQVTIEETARVQADAVDLHIRQLTLRRGVLRAIARGASRPEEVQRMTAYARASADESRRIMDAFLDAVFAEHQQDPFATRMRAAMPVLPDRPSDAQVDAWIELAGLVQDEAFRERVREMIVAGERQRAVTGITETEASTQQAGEAVLQKAGAAVARGISPTAHEAQATVTELVALFAAAAGKADTAQYRRELLAQLEQFSDRRVNRYWQLTGVINGWPERPDMFAPYEWFIDGLRALLG
jgi:DNA-binding transcriptional MerR regulator